MHAQVSDTTMPGLILLPAPEKNLEAKYDQNKKSPAIIARLYDI
jgi:hypothetical protein